ncbi:MAG: cytochrome c3 family protein [Desulfobacterales bacterium]|nr:cytochrome c3 family protein [Desulfobacterales bacterium]
MFKICVGVLSLILAVIFGNALMVAGQEPAEAINLPLGKIVIKAPESVEPKRPPSYLTHSLHFGYMCSECHHTWEFNTQVKKCTAPGCHDLTVSARKSKKSGSNQPEEIMYYMRAYHKQCIVCHLELKRANLALEMSLKILKEKLPPTGPTGCIECHPVE